MKMAIIGGLGALAGAGVLYFVSWLYMAHEEQRYW